MKHKHTFKNIGGGIDMLNGKSDDSYKCSCGLKFKVYSDIVGHRFLPEIIKEEDFSELKNKEQEKIISSQFYDENGNCKYNKVAIDK